MPLLSTGRFCCYSENSEILLSAASQRNPFACLWTKFLNSAVQTWPSFVLYQLSHLNGCVYFFSFWLSSNRSTSCGQHVSLSFHFSMNVFRHLRQLMFNGCLWKTALQNHIYKLWSDRVFFRSIRWWMSEVEIWTGRRANRQRKNGTGECLWRSGATSQSCKVTQAIRNVHDQPESHRTWPAMVNLLRPVEFNTIPQPQILDAWHQWRNTGRVFVTSDFLAIFGRLFDRVPVRILASDFHHRPYKKDPQFFLEIMIFECSFPF